MARRLLALIALAVLLPAAQAQTGLGLGGLAPQAAPGPEAAVANIAVPTDLCTRQFCLQAAPTACSGDCILTALGNTTSYCAADCIAVWDSATVQSCLAGKAAGAYIQDQLSAISTKCNAGKIAAARRAAALKKYNTLFPCTKTAGTNSTTLLGLDTCQTGTNATATNCGATCLASLTAIPAKCRNTFPTLAPAWNSTLESCIPSPDAPAAAPSADASAAGAGALALAPAAAPSSSASPPASQGAPPLVLPSGLIAAMLVMLAAAMLA